MAARRRWIVRAVQLNLAAAASSLLVSANDKMVAISSSGIFLGGRFAIYQREWSLAVVVTQAQSSGRLGDLMFGWSYAFCVSMQLFYVTKRYDAKILVGRSDDGADESVFSERFLRDGSGVSAGLFFGPREVCLFLAWRDGCVARAPVSELRSYRGDSREFLESIAQNHHLVIDASEAVRDVFLADIVGKLHLEMVPRLSVRDCPD